MNTLKIGLAVITVATAATVAFAARADTIVKIGVAGPLSGQQAASGKDNERGSQLAIEDLNAKKIVVSGQQIRFQLVPVDDQGDPKTAVIVAQQMVDEGVAVVIGHNNSGTTIPASKIYNDGNVVMITPAASNPALTKPGFSNVFRLTTDDNVLGANMAEYAVKTLHVQRVAVIDDRTAYGSGIADVFVESAKKLGLQVVDREYATDHTVDFKALLTTMKAQKPQVIFYGGVYPQAANLARQMRDFQMAAVLMGGDGLCSSEFPKLAEGALDGKMYCPEAGAPLDALPDGAKFSSRFKSKFGIDVDAKGPSFYAATMLAGDAIVAANSTSPQAIAAALHNKSFNGLLGAVKFDRRGEWVAAPMTIYKLTGSALKPVIPN